MPGTAAPQPGATTSTHPAVETESYSSFAESPREEQCYLIRRALATLAPLQTAPKVCSQQTPDGQQSAGQVAQLSLSCVTGTVAASGLAATGPGGRVEDARLRRRAACRTRRSDAAADRTAIGTEGGFADASLRHLHCSRWVDLASTVLTQEVRAAVAVRLARIVEVTARNTPIGEHAPVGGRATSGA